MTRHTNIEIVIPLAASSGAADTNGAAVSLDRGGELSIQMLIDNGAGLAPTDTPVGTFQLWTSADSKTYTRLTSTAIDAELAKLSPNGNNLVSAWANFEGVPGVAAKILYVRGSGGATARGRALCVTG